MPQKGGELNVLASGDVDYMDPGAAYYQFTYMITNAGHRTLLTWDPDDTEEPTPDGAEDYPEVWRRRQEPDVHDPRRDGVRSAGGP